MGVNRFEDLRVWQAAKQQCDQVWALLQRPALRSDPGLVDQLSRASTSVVFNVTEGFLRRRDKETMQFLRYAMASNGELKAAYYVAEGRACLSAGEMPERINLNESIAKMLNRWYAILEARDPRNVARGRNQARTKDQGRTTGQGRTKH